MDDNKDWQFANSTNGESIMNIFNLGNHDDINSPAMIPERLKKNERIVIITADNVEDLEFFYPYYRFNEEGYDVDVVTPEGGSFKGKHGYELKNTKSINDVNASDYVLLYLPGGKAPEKLRKDERVLSFVKRFAANSKPIASICHGAQILISADLVKGFRIAAWPEIKKEVEEAGGIFVDEALVESGQFITSRKPGDLHRHLDGVMRKLRETNTRQKTA